MKSLEVEPLIKDIYDILRWYYRIGWTDFYFWILFTEKETYKLLLK